MKGNANLEADHVTHHINVQSKNKRRHYAGAGARVLAAIIDFLLFYLLFLLALGSFGASFSAPKAFVGYVVSIIITFVMWQKFMGTPGKLLMECQVVDANSHQAITLKQSVLRYLGYLLSAATLGLLYLWILYDKQRRGLHDRLANTVVLRKATLFQDDESQKDLKQLMNEIR